MSRVRDGHVDVGTADETLSAALREQPFADLGFAKVDHHRSIRVGFPEVVLGLGKTPDQIAKISSQIVERGHPLLVTRADEAAWKSVQAAVPGAEYHEVARCITLKREM